MPAITDESPTMAAAPREVQVTHGRSRGAVIKLGIGVGILLASALVAVKHQREWEYPVIRSINTYANRSALLDYFNQVLTECDLLQGAALVSLLWYLWFRNENGGIRTQLIVGTVAASFAG